jgi:16S rRNA (uracil1498-N3)-methyltransferase
MSERFFSSNPIITDGVTLDGPEAHHLLHVMRAAAGDTVTLFDGSGNEFQAIVETLRRTHVELRIVARDQISRELPFTLEVGVALPKGDRQKWLIEKLTELGVSSLVPLFTERSVSQPTGNALERLRRSTIEASKQCCRNKLMAIAEPQLAMNWLKSASRKEFTRRGGQSEIEYRRLIAHLEGKSVSEIELTQYGPTQLAIGPEGGFTDAEVEAAVAAGWQKVSLGPRTLRTETAAVALAAAIGLR